MWATSVVGAVQHYHLLIRFSIVELQVSFFVYVMVCKME